MSMRKPASPTTIHRRAKQAPTLRDVQRAQRAATRARADAAEEQRRAAAEQLAAERAAKTERRARQLRDMAVAACARHGLDGVALRAAVNAIMAKVERDPGANPYRVARDVLAARGHGVRVPSGSPLDAQLPPPPPEAQGFSAPGIRPSDEQREQRRAAAEAEKRRAERIRTAQDEDRARYEQRLRSMGLDVPSHGWSGSLGTYTGR